MKFEMIKNHFDQQLGIMENKILKEFSHFGHE